MNHSVYYNFKTIYITHIHTRTHTHTHTHTQNEK